VSSASNAPDLLLENTNTDANDAQLTFFKNSASPADDDTLGDIEFQGDDDGGANSIFAFIRGVAKDVNATDEGGEIVHFVTIDGDLREFFTLTGYNGTINQGEIIFNEESEDVDIRIEADDDVNAFFVQGSNGDIGMGTGTPSEFLHLFDSVNNEPTILLESTSTGTLGPIIKTYLNSASPADNDNISTIQFIGEDDVSAITTYSRISAKSQDVTNGNEAGSIEFDVTQNGSEVSYLMLDGSNGSVDEGQIIFNEDSRDVDVRVESDNNVNALFVQGSDGFVGVNTAAPQSALDVSGAITADTYNFAADGQADDDYEIALPGISTLTTGLRVTFTATTANTSGATLEITSVGALDAILNMNDQALATGDIEAGQVVECVFDGTNWQMTSQLAQ